MLTRMHKLLCALGYHKRRVVQLAFGWGQISNRCIWCHKWIIPNGVGGYVAIGEDPMNETLEDDGCAARTA